MIDIRYIKHFFCSLALMPLLAGCAEDAFDAPGDPSTSVKKDKVSLVINLIVPEGNTPADVKNVRSRADNPDPFMDLEGNEGTITELRVVAYTAGTGERAINESLTVPAEIPQNPDKVAVYEIENLDNGDYRLYLLANLESMLENQDYSTESKLKEALMKWSATSLPTPGALPMVYEPENPITVDNESTENQELTCSLKIAAVKLRYAIIFDRRVAQHTMFGTGGLRLTDLKIEQLQTQARVIEDQTYYPSASPTVFSIDGAKVPFKYYTADSNDYLNENNYNVSNHNMVDMSRLEETVSPDYTGDWVAVGTVYLPECYPRNSSYCPRMTISGEIVDVNGETVQSTSYSIRNLSQYTGGASDDYRLPRGTYYEVVGKITSVGSLSQVIAAKDWQEEVLPVDFVHTYLTLDRTEVTVKSNEDAEIEYLTDGRSGVKFSCETLDKAGGNPLIAHELTEHDGKTYIVIKVNNDIDINQMDESMLKTDGAPISCYIIAGNIKKEIKVNYDIEPFFVIDPETLTFNWNDINSGSTMSPRYFTFETNLGGLRLFESDASAAKGDEVTQSLASGLTHSMSISYVDNLGNEMSKTSTIRITCIDADASTGRLKVESLGDPGAVAHHYFLGTAKNTYKGVEFSDTVMVAIIPAQGDYRVYFRAINDYQKHNFHEVNSNTDYGYNSEFLDGDYANWPAEYTGTLTSASDACANWLDWWNMDPQSFSGSNYGDPGYRNVVKTPSDTIANHSHHIYIYGQNGETFNGQQGTSWHFSGRNSLTAGDGTTGKWYWTSPAMRGDYHHPGWYFYDLPQSTYAIESEYSMTRVEPGKTLFIFYAHKDRNGSNWGANGVGYETHRCSHHNDPGVPLFNYEDREGWYLYDPTREPYYKVYDEKPVIEDVTYVVYTKNPVTGWWRTYGVAEDKTRYENPREYTLFYNFSLGECVKVNGTDWYKTEFKLKAPQGDYSKNIHIKIEQSTTTTTTENVSNFVVCGVYDRWWRSWGDWGANSDQQEPPLSRPPYAYFLNASGQQVGAAWPGTEMTRFTSGTNHGANDYWVEVPAGAENGYVIFNANWKYWSGDRQYDLKLPESNTSYPNVHATYGGLPLNGKMGYVNYTNNWNDNWFKYGGSAPTREVTTTETTVMEPILFGAQSYPIDGQKRVCGYYDGSKWHAGKPADVN